VVFQNTVLAPWFRSLVVNDPSEFNIAWSFSLGIALSVREEHCILSQLLIDLVSHEQVVLYPLDLGPDVH
jgi:hypothetical protein